MALRDRAGRQFANMHIHDDPKRPQGVKAGFGIGRERAGAGTEEGEEGDGGEGEGNIAWYIIDLAAQEQGSSRALDGDPSGQEEELAGDHSRSLHVADTGLKIGWGGNGGVLLLVLDGCAQ